MPSAFDNQCLWWEPLRTCPNLGLIVDSSHVKRYRRWKMNEMGIEYNGYRELQELSRKSIKQYRQRDWEK